MSSSGGTDLDVHVLLELLDVLPLLSKLLLDSQKPLKPLAYAHPTICPLFPPHIGWLYVLDLLLLPNVELLGGGLTLGEGITTNIIQSASAPYTKHKVERREVGLPSTRAGRSACARADLSRHDAGSGRKKASGGQWARSLDD